MANNGNKANSPGARLENIYKGDPVMEALIRGNSWANAMEIGNPNFFKQKTVSNAHNNTNRNIKHDFPAWAYELDPAIQDSIRDLIKWESDETYLGSGWHMPDLRMRKAIWENFPVVLTPIDDGDGTERYAISWHKKHLAEWRHDSDHTLSINEYQDYEMFSEYKLLYSLAKHPRQYRIEPPRNNDQIAIIAMVHGMRRNNRNTRANNRVNRANNRNTRKVNRNVPTLRKLVDIKDHFPVTWNEVPGKAGTKTYALQIHNKKLSDMSVAAGRNMRGELTQKLMTALRASSFWNVLPAGPGEFARLEMRTKL
jgi:hypothetical protein